MTKDSSAVLTYKITANCFIEFEFTISKFNVNTENNQIDFELALHIKDLKYWDHIFQFYPNSMEKYASRNDL